MTVSEINSFFQDHPLKEKFFSFTEAERSGCAAVAQRDVEAAVFAVTERGEKENALIDAAIAEQTVFLLLNPEYLTGTYTRTAALNSAGESRRFFSAESVLGQRAAALIAPLLQKSAAAGNTQNSDPDSSGKDPDSSGKDPEKEPEKEPEEEFIGGTLPVVRG